LRAAKLKMPADLLFLTLSRYDNNSNPKRRTRIMIQKLAWAILLLGLSSTLLYAAPQMSHEKDSAMQTVTGCLQKGEEPGGMYVISTEDKHWELYPAKDVSLAEHVGHTVTVSGTEAHRSAAQEKKSQPHEKSEMGSKEHADLNVTKIEHVSDTCKQ
jgi:hypothetical protein